MTITLKYFREIFLIVVRCGNNGWEKYRGRLGVQLRQGEVWRPGVNFMINGEIQGYDPVKISIKNFQNTQWLVACMIPKGNMMASTLNKLEGENYDLIEFRCSNKKETPEENKQLEEEFKLFLEKGISKISRQGIQGIEYESEAPIF